MGNNNTKTDEAQEFEQIPGEIPVLPLYNTVIYPDISMPIALSDQTSITLIEETLADHKVLGVVTQKSDDTEELKPDNLYSVGAVVKPLKMFRTPEEKVYALVQGISRMKITGYTQEKPYYRARVDVLRDSLHDDQELAAMVTNVKHLLMSIAKLGANISQEILTMLLNIDSPGILADMSAEIPGFSLQERQELLETLDVKSRLRRVIGILTREQDTLELSRKIQSQVQNKMDKSQREYYLREQLKAIQQELGELDEQGGAPVDEIEQLRDKIKKSGMSKAETTRLLAEAYGIIYDDTVRAGEDLLPAPYI